MNLLDLARAAGPLLWVILALSLYVVYLGIMRVLELGRLGHDSTSLVDRVRVVLAENGPHAAQREVDLAGLDTPAAHVMRAGLSRADYGIPAVESAMNSALIHQDARLYAGLSALGTAAQIAPLLGLLGTVVGMVRSFLVFSQNTTPTPTQLATGISEALVNTAAGLIVAILAYVLRNTLRNRANLIAAHAEQVREELPSWIAAAAQKAPLSQPLGQPMGQGVTVPGRY